MSLTSAQKRLSGVWHLRATCALLANATRAVLGTVRRSAVLNTRHSVRSVPGRSVVVYEVARGFSGGQEFATSINVANEGSVTGVTELGVQHAVCEKVRRQLLVNSRGRYLPPAAHPLKVTALCGSGLVYACVY